MTQLVVEIPTDVRWDEAALKRFLESAPYYLEGGLVTNVVARTVTVESPSTRDPSVLHDKLAHLARSIGRTLRDSTDATLFDYTPRPPEGRPDPMPALFETGSVVRVGHARFAYGGLLAHLLDSLDRHLSDYAQGTGAERQIYPTTVATQTLLRAGYLSTFPQHAFFVASAARSNESLEQIARCSQASDLDAPREAPLLGGHEQVLSPTVCYPCLESLQDTELGRPRAITAMNPCHRFEILASSSLERLHTFRMREIVFFGDAEFVATSLDSSLDWTAALFRRWGLAHRASTATDPFFAGAAGKTFFQSTFALKRELRLRLDFSGAWLPVASFNNHQQSLMRSFDIRWVGGTLWSGCVGWGYERILYALFAQLGTDPRAWPEAVREDLRCSI